MPASMSCTLKDLAPAEKQKVARLIRQVVEKERQLRELEEAFQAAKREGEQGSCAGAASSNAAAKAEQLAEQNLELARENTSLRAKLSHAFDLLRAYQHKCRVLDATVQITGVGSLSRPITPTWDAVQPQQLAARLGMLGGSSRSSVDFDGPDGTPGAPELCLDEHKEAEAGTGSRHGVSRQLSPVCEGTWEGASPGSPACTCSIAGTQQQAAAQLPTHPDVLLLAHRMPNTAAVQHPLGTTVAASIAGAGSAGLELVLPQAALPQLDTLKLMAQALLEAQAEVAAKQTHQQQAQLQQAHQQQAQPQHAQPPPQQRVQPPLQQQQHQEQQQQQQAQQLPPPQEQQQHHQHQAQQQPLQQEQCGWPGPRGNVPPQACMVRNSPDSGGSAPHASVGMHSGCSSPLPSTREDPSTSDGSLCTSSSFFSSEEQHTAIGPAVQERAPLVALQQHQQIHGPREHTQGNGCGGSQYESLGPRALPPGRSASRSIGSGGRASCRFDGDLMDLVRDVEGLLQPDDAASWPGLERCKGGGEGGSARSGQLTLPVQQALYEENDLYELISQL